MGRIHLVFVAMWCVVAIHTNLSQASPQDMRSLTAHIRKKCLAETGTTADIVDDAEIGNFPEDEKLKCYFKCSLKQFNMITKDGKLNINLMKRLIPDDFKDVGIPMIEECQDTTGKNACDLAFNFNKCLYYSNPMAFFVA